jgi:hypothetical protein
MGTVRAIVESEGFAVHPDKTRVSRSGGRQRVTGMVVNGKGTPRVSRKVRREVRAALHNLGNGKGMKEGESLPRLTGYAAYIYMSQPALGATMFKRLAAATGSLSPAP